MNIIVAVDKSWGIGKDNDLLFHIPEDMRFFKEMTLDKTVVMGRKTLLSLPGGRPLKNRRNIVLTKDTALSVPDVEIAHSTTDVATLLGGSGGDFTFVIGGASIYKQFLPHCQKAYVTKIDADGDAHCHFPDLDALPHWILTEISEQKEHNGIYFRFCLYENLAPEDIR